jgi:NADH-quinone oxidoreductase subunit E
MIVDGIEQHVHMAVKAAIQKHGASRDALIPILSQVNREFGFIPPEAVSEIKQQLQASSEHVPLSEGQIYSVASFYRLLSTRKLGRHVVRFCESAPCHVMGGRELVQAVKDFLQIDPGETSPDDRWTLIMTSCVGLCAEGPLLLVDDDLYGKVEPYQLPEIFNKYA